MANTCTFDLIIYSKDKETGEQICKIMNHDVPGLYMANVYDSVSCSDPKYLEEYGCWRTELHGESRWCTSHAFYGDEDTTEPDKEGDICTSLKALSKEMNFGCMLIDDEPGCVYHYQFARDNLGNIIMEKNLAEPIPEKIQKMLDDGDDDAWDTYEEYIESQVEYIPPYKLFRRVD